VQPRGAPHAPFPTVAAAVWLTVLGSLSSLFVIAAIAAGGDQQIGVAGAAFGLAVGFGGVATLAARQVPPPQAERIGLRVFRPAFLLPILLLVPITLLASEVDNLARAVFPPPDAAQIGDHVRRTLATDDVLGALQSAILTVGIAPVIEEFFFRGVVQQGLVTQLGVGWGVVVTALLFGLGHGAPGISAAAWLAAAAGTFGYGVVLGWLRVWSGSILAPILLHAGLNAAGLAATALAEDVPIAGYNAPGPHTAPALLAAAAASALVGLVLARRAGRSEPPAAAPVRQRETEPPSGD
jgi:hypothetical protein